MEELKFNEEVWFGEEDGEIDYWAESLYSDEDEKVFTKGSIEANESIDDQ